MCTVGGSLEQARLTTITSKTRLRVMVPILLPANADPPWHFVDASGETVIVIGLSPGCHKVLIELADPTHKVITGVR